MTATGFSETAVVTEQASRAAKLETFIGGVLNSNLNCFHSFSRESFYLYILDTERIVKRSH
jgi:hypothetical protein